MPANCYSKNRGSEIEILRHPLREAKDLHLREAKDLHLREAKDLHLREAKELHSLCSVSRHNTG
jgi:hypothetical protein